MDFVFGVLRAVLKLALLAFVSLMVAGFLVLGLIAALFALLWALLTGRKPTAWTTFVRFRQASQQFRQGVWQRQNGAAAAASPDTADIVDVQVKEVRTGLEHHPKVPHRD